MLKLISVLVAICAMTVSINVSAATSDRVITSETRNDVTELGISFDAEKLPTFRAGDVLEFNVSELTADTTLTLISYKYDTRELNNSTVQYLYEYDLAASDTKVINYKVRDINDGIYKIVLNGNDGKNVAEFYYKVGTPKVSIVTGTDATTGKETNYYVSEAFPQKDGSYLYSVAFVGKATIGGDISFEDVGLESVGLGFNLKDKNTGAALYKDLTTEQLNALLPTLKKEINGSLTFYFGVTMLRIPQEDLSDIIATPRLDEEAILAE